MLTGSRRVGEIDIRQQQHKNADRVLIAQLKHLREFWSDLFLILQSDENICINEELAASHVHVW
jgi:hypothetical protein